MAQKLTDANRAYYERRYSEEIARSVEAADMTAAMPHRRLAHLYATLLRDGSVPSPGSVQGEGAKPAGPFMLGDNDDV